MNTFSTLPASSPAWPLTSVLCSKKLWLRVNRTLAWSLVVSPIAQLMLGSALVPGLLLDLAILLVHGGLSIWLFGAPKATRPIDTAWTRWMGASYADMSPRNRFLLSGWRVALSSGYQVALVLLAIGLTALGGYLGWLPGVLIGMVAVPLYFLMVSAGGFFGSMLPYAIITHLFGASRYATRRWGFKNFDAAAISALVVMIFAVLSIVNLFRPLWS
jgi:hypothetical protein